ncbi:MAG TPA: DNA mismatch repair protein MutS [Polyangiaceae bacterium]|nr:DNA mismatch repair protein MutS [Polyangiaceae bacterium]
MQDTAHSPEVPPAQGLRTPLQAHAARQTALMGEAHRLGRASSLVSTLRLVTLLVAVALTFAIGFRYAPAWTGWIAGSSFVAFVALVVRHIELDRKERRVAAGIAYHRWATHRLEGKFEAYPARGDRFQSDAHPYSADLGLFGEGSLFQLLDSTHTRRGEDCLAGWLSEPSSKDAVVERQNAVRELALLTDLRENLAVQGTLIAADKPDPDPLLKWAEGPSLLSADPLVRWLAFAVPLSTGAAYAFVLLGQFPTKYWLLLLLGQWLYGMSLMPKIEPTASATSSREGALARYRTMLELIESTNFAAARLTRLKGDLALAKTGRAASGEVRKLSSIVGFLDARQNEVFRLFIGPLVLWDAHCVLALERWQKRAGKNVRRWLEVIGEMEALSSLAGFAHDHPDAAWPTLTETPAFDAEALGHPLVPKATRVRNDVRLRGAGTALLVTGSNMSGKSTLLRSMGIGAVMAMAGAPVVARRLEISPFELRTSMWARDSLIKGVSHFYAELLKLKRVVDGLSGGRPLFFLLDEILQGTNSRERVIGARSVLRHLLEHGAMGAVSTHDIGLLELSPELDAKLDKVHFEEQVTTENGVSSMTFDYQLRPGVVRSTNALRLMKRVGIDVDVD